MGFTQNEDRAGGNIFNLYADYNCFNLEPFKRKIDDCKIWIKKTLLKKIAIRTIKWTAYLSFLMDASMLMK